MEPSQHADLDQQKVTPVFDLDAYCARINYTGPARCLQPR